MVPMSNPTANLLASTHRELAVKLMEGYRATNWNETDILADLTALREGMPSWRSELLWALSHANGIPLHALYDAIGVAPAVVMQRRRKDALLAHAISNYLGAYLEDEAQMPVRGIAANVLLTGLEKHADGWEKQEGRQLTDEDVHKLIRGFIDSVRLRVTDLEVVKLIGDDITAHLAKIRETQDPE